jgi:uncharacterized protein (TIGR02996 family)
LALAVLGIVVTSPAATARQDGGGDPAPGAVRDRPKPFDFENWREQLARDLARINSRPAQPMGDTTVGDVVVTLAIVLPYMAGLLVYTEIQRRKYQPQEHHRPTGWERTAGFGGRGGRRPPEPRLSPRPQPNAGVELVYVVPDCAAMARAYQRSADDAAFWRAILAAPDDDLPRLVYADWLDDHGDPAGDILRDRAPLVLNYEAGAGDGWEHRNRRGASWRQVVNEFSAFAAQGGRLWANGPEAAPVALTRFAPRPQATPAGGAGEYQRLSVSLESGAPVPPFVNSLLIHLGFALWLRSILSVARAAALGTR